METTHRDASAGEVRGAAIVLQLAYPPAAFGRDCVVVGVSEVIDAVSLRRCWPPRLRSFRAYVSPVFAADGRTRMYFLNDSDCDHMADVIPVTMRRF